MEKILIGSSNYKLKKFMEIPYTGIYGADAIYNKTSFVFLYNSNRFNNLSLGYLFFNTKMEEPTLIEQRLVFDEISNFYYKVKESCVELYVRSIPNTSGVVTILSAHENINYSLIYDPAPIEVSEGISSTMAIPLKNFDINRAYLLNTNITNFYCNRSNVNNWNETITFDLSSFLKNQNMFGIVRVYNIVHKDDTKLVRYLEGAILTNGEFVPSRQNDENPLTLTIDTNTKTITVGGKTGPGGISIEYIPHYAIN